MASKSMGDSSNGNSADVQIAIWKAHLHLGAMAQSRGDLTEAIQQYQCVLDHRPNHPDTLLLLATAYEEAGELGKSEACLRLLISIAPHCDLAHTKLALLRDSLGFTDEALRLLEHAMNLDPASAPAFFSYGTLLIKQNRVTEAVRFLNWAVQLDPNLFQAASSTLDGLLEANVAQWEKSILENPTNLNAILCLARAKKDPVDAAAFARRALAIDPGNPHALFCLSVAELVHGEFEIGWKHYESRFATGQPEFELRSFSQPRWTGEDLNGRIILVFSEQGFGDTIQFIRFIGLLESRGARVIVECQPALKRLLQTTIGSVFAKGEPLPYFDYQIPVMSLPSALQTTLETIPENIPYLRPPLSVNVVVPQSETPCFKVGVVWAGNPGLPTDLRRSIPLSKLQPILNVPKARFYSLQVGPAKKQLEILNDPASLVDLSHLMPDFAATASLIEKLDLVITVCTSVAHLAGAMGKPVWVLLPAPCEWRWLLDREDSPWYPSARLFRQSQPGDWHSVIQRVVAELEKLAVH